MLMMMIMIMIMMMKMMMMPPRTSSLRLWPSILCTTSRTGSTTTSRSWSWTGTSLRLTSCPRSASPSPRSSAAWTSRQGRQQIWIFSDVARGEGACRPSSGGFRGSGLLAFDIPCFWCWMAWILKAKMNKLSDKFRIKLGDEIITTDLLATLMLRSCELNELYKQYISN